MCDDVRVEESGDSGQSIAGRGATPSRFDHHGYRMRDVSRGVRQSHGPSIVGRCRPARILPPYPLTKSEDIEVRSWVDLDQVVTRFGQRSERVDEHSGNAIDFMQQELLDLLVSQHEMHGH